MSSQQQVYTFTNVFFEVKSKRFSVATVTLALRETSIPLLRLVIDPKHGPSDPIETASAGTLESVTENLNWLLGLAEEKTTDTRFSLEMRGRIDDVPDQLVQELKLNGWVLNSVGLIGVSAAAGFSLELELLHPIASLQMSGLNMGSFSALWPDKLGTVTAPDIPGGIAAALTMFGNLPVDESRMDVSESLGICNFPGLNMQGLKQEWLRKILRARDTLNNHLEWSTAYVANCNYNKWPLMCLPSDFTEIMQYALVSYVVKGLDSNVWELLARSICPEWFLSIIPTYWESKLKIQPFQPWNEPLLTFNDDAISDINFPGTDPSPVDGVWIDYARPGTSAEHTSLTGNPDMESPIAYSGIGYISKANGIGQIMLTAAPSWYAAWLNLDAARNGDSTSLAVAEEDWGTEAVMTSARVASYDDVSVSDNYEGADFNHAQYRAGLYAIAKQTYLTYCRQGVQVILKCPLLITSQDVAPYDPFRYHVIPGVSAKVQTVYLRSGSGNIYGYSHFHFHVTSVIHVIDCQQAQAYTEVGGQYARQPGGWRDTQGVVRIAEPTCNPIYSNTSTPA